MQVLAINKRVQAQNNAPPGFPNFVRQGYEIAILADDYQESEEGLIWKVGNLLCSAVHMAFCKPSAFVCPGVAKRIHCSCQS